MWETIKGVLPRVLGSLSSKETSGSDFAYRKLAGLSFFVLIAYLHYDLVNNYSDPVITSDLSFKYLLVDTITFLSLIGVLLAQRLAEQAINIKNGIFKTTTEETKTSTSSTESRTGNAPE
jgi:hypothetical protein